MLQKHSFIFFVALWLVCLSIGCSQSKTTGAPADVPATFKLTSTAFADGGAIPAKYGLHGLNVSPPLAWKGAPAGTKSFVLIVEDPDAPSGTWVHWVAYNIAGNQTGLPEGIPKAATASNPSMDQGRNGWGNVGYDGPAPPSGAHHYYFRLVALNIDKLTGVATTASAADVRTAIAGHELGHATLMGAFSAQ